MTVPLPDSKVLNLDLIVSSSDFTVASSVLLEDCDTGRSSAPVPVFPHR